MKSWLDVAGAMTRRVRGSEFARGEGTALREQIAACISAAGGDVAQRERARTLWQRYSTLSPAGRRAFLEIVSEFDVDRGVLDAALARVANATADDRPGAERALRAALVPARMTLLRAFNSVPNGVKFLVDLRAELLLMTDASTELRALEADVKELLAGWFDIGFLQLQRITWDAPASLLERLARYEAVHDIRGWTDLKNRLDTDRRCFAFLHPAMPDEPLIFIEVALLDGMADAMAPLLDTSAPLGSSAPTHAIFYSISNCQKGLEGISFGNALIKRVVRELSLEFRSVRTFATLSPIPGFRRWLSARTVSGERDDEPLARVFSGRTWARDDASAAAVREPLLQLAAHYLLEAKRPNGRALDPVAHFHISNGAGVGRIHWLADPSLRGRRESGGMMVNYLYDLDRIDQRQRAYAVDGRIDASPAVLALVQARS